MWLAVVAVILGVLGCVLPLAPVDLTGLRGYIALAFGLPGLVVGIIGCTGRRRGKALAVAGSILCVIALVMAAVVLINSTKGSSAKNSPGDHTRENLRDDLDVRLGDVHADPATGHNSVTVTLYNKGRDIATFGVTLQQTNRNSGETCETDVSVSDLSPGASYQTEMGTCGSATSPQYWSLKVTNATKDVP